MSHFAAKLRRIILPYFFIAFVVIGLYTFLHWCFIIKHRMIVADETAINVFITSALSGLLIIVFLRKRIKYLVLVNKVGRHDPVFNIGFIACLSIAIPAIIAQEYIEQLTGGLTKLDHVTQIKQYPITKYYTLKRSFVDKSGVKVLYGSDVARKSKYSSDRYYEMELYFCMPILDNASQVYIDSGYMDVPEPYRNATFILNGKKISRKELKNIRPAAVEGFRMLNPEYALKTYDADTVIKVILNKRQYTWKPTHAKSGTPVAWLGFKYEERIDDALSQQEKDREKQDFYERSLAKLKSKQLNDFIYLDRVKYSKDYRGYVAAIGGEKREWSTLIFSPVYEPFESRSNLKLLFIIGGFVTGSLIFILMVGYKQLRVPYR
ncbi:hypothetical protein LT679_11340 [Mucilaginibacter roseus]|uniref:ResB-like domain-containing protein n=1 Tax=Mucilaginibacter roseus TaxID=1528868 RepID=A0ABS8U581_9SPHI|nr:hypothetical protein [Mucilaginibacter roseus]MCD8741198.1 hypothetical protein [Mucilaginibacter roseus]